jgi:hypothetical protein
MSQTCFSNTESLSNLPNVVFMWLTLLIHIWEVPGSNLGPETGYPKVFCGFTQPLQANARIVP